MNIKKSFLIKAIVMLLVFGSLFSGLVGCISINYDWVNKLSTECMQANFGVYTTYKNFDFFGNPTSSKMVFGSGVLFLAQVVDGGEPEYYYLLTNNHTVAKNDEFEQIAYEVKDYKGNTYPAVLIDGLAEYDLAVLKFEANDEISYTPLPLASKNVMNNVRVAALGQPHGQANMVTIGRVVGYNEIMSGEDVTALSNVLFDVIYHDAPIDTGSSGGALLNENCQVVGINFAMTVSKTDDDVAYGCAIPIEKVREFLEKIELIGFKRN